MVAAFTPWNFPVLTPARKVGGALASGCSLILKASEETPGACVEMVRCFADAGLPAGVLNLVFGVPAEVSEHLLAKDAVSTGWDCPRAEESSKSCWSRSGIVECLSFLIVPPFCRWRT